MAAARPMWQNPAMSSQLSSSVVFFALGSLAAACGDKCGADETEVGGVCRTVCEQDSECGQLEVCEAELCTACEATCVTAPDCAPGDHCVSVGNGCTVCGPCDCDRDVGICNAEPGTTIVCACDRDCTGASACSGDGVCDAGCSAGADPDCAACACDRVAGRCDAEQQDSATACDCDADCIGHDACEDDGDCDDYCLGRDSDCPCACDYYGGVCEAESDGSADECTCDPQCAAAGNNACQADGHCDTWCDPGGLCSDGDCDNVGTGACA
jgi:hypothetical protein